MSALGITYSTEAGAIRRIVEAGGLAPLWDDGFARVGVSCADEPQAGDVGVIRRLTICALDEAAAIYTGERWVSLGLRGLDFAPAEAIQVWRV